MKEAPDSTLEMLPSPADYPVLNPVRFNIYSTDGSDNFCGICLENDGETMVCCDYCQRCFHLTCHVPKLGIEKGLKKWRCPFQTDKAKIDKRLASLRNNSDSVDGPLDESNKRQFGLACNFVLQVYDFPESPTIRYIFPQKYYELFGKMPFNLKYIKERLGEGKPEPFASAKDMLLAFKQLFVQSSIYYREIRNKEYTEVAERCFMRFLEFVSDYYPGYFDLFEGIQF